MHIGSLKKKTKLLPISEFKSPEMFFLPLHAYKEEMFPVINLGEYVKKYQLVAKSTGFFASQIHAPVSGFFNGIELINGASYLKIKNDFREEEFERETFSVENLISETILKIIKEYGIEGSGGARFPAHLKYAVAEKSIETLIINGAECEPYLSADYALMRHKTEELFKAISIIQKIINAQKVIIAFEKQHKELKSVFKPFLNKYNFEVGIKLLPNEYPQGGELQLIKSVTGKELQKGSIPAEHGVVVTNTGTLYAIYNAIFENKPYIERVITISGEKASIIGNFLVKIGTPASFLLEKLGMNWNKDQTIIFGGPMMGKAIQNKNEAINKGTGGVLILPQSKNNRYNCIQCGYCADVCPQHLLPMEFARHEISNDIEKLMSLNISDCIECGACAYICPSDLPLMKSIFTGKKAIQNIKNNE